MKPTLRAARTFLAAVGTVCGVLALGMGPAIGKEVKVMLSGGQEVPPVSTTASATGDITIGDDMSVSGSVTTSGINATMAHIHMAAPGSNGPPIVHLKKTGDNVWSVPPGAKLTAEQYKSYQAGDLYINVHSDAHDKGELRGQIKP